MAQEPPKSEQRLQELMTSILRRQLAQSLAEVEAALARWRGDEFGVFEAHAEVLRHAARAERLAERMARVGPDTADSLLRDAYDNSLIERDEFVELVGKEPEEVEPSRPIDSDPGEGGLPDKRELVEDLLDNGAILVHVDARDRRAEVPGQFRDDPKLVLRFGYGLTPAIVDLTVDDNGMCGTLTFGGVPFRCELPWHAVYAVVSEVDQKGMVWPEDVPAPVVDQLTAHSDSNVDSNDSNGRPVFDSVDGAADGVNRVDVPPPPRRKGGHLKLVK